MTTTSYQTLQPSWATDPRTPSRYGSYTHTRDCDMHTLGYAVATLVDNDTDVTIENMHHAVFGFRDAFPHRPCLGGCGELELRRVGAELVLARRALRHAYSQDTQTRIYQLQNQRAAIRAELGTDDD